MAKGYKTGGRSSGTVNKRTEDVIERLQALGRDPIEGMAKLAMDETIDLSIRAQMYKELAQYVAPKRKAVEMQIDVDEGISMAPISATEELLKRIRNEQESKKPLH